MNINKYHAIYFVLQYYVFMYVCILNDHIFSQEMCNKLVLFFQSSFAIVVILFSVYYTDMPSRQNGKQCLLSFMK